MAMLWTTSLCLQQHMLTYPQALVSYSPKAPINRNDQTPDELH